MKIPIPWPISHSSLIYDNKNRVLRQTNTTQSFRKQNKKASRQICWYLLEQNLIAPWNRKSYQKRKEDESFGREWKELRAGTVHTKERNETKVDILYQRTRETVVGAGVRGSMDWGFRHLRNNWDVVTGVHRLLETFFCSCWPNCCCQRICSEPRRRRIGSSKEIMLRLEIAGLAA